MLYETNYVSHYIGIDTGFNLIFVLWYYANIYYGMMYKRGVIELSTGVWQEPRSNRGSIGPTKTSTVLSLTPKLGFNFNNFELKIGHSFILYDDNDEWNIRLLDTGIINFNIDIGLTYPLGDSF